MTSHKVNVLTGQQALTYVNTKYLVLMAFAREKDLQPVLSQISRRCELKGIKIVRVEPNETNAVELQLSRYPTYILYRSGNEDRSCLGTDAFLEGSEAFLS